MSSKKSSGSYVSFILFLLLDQRFILKVIILLTLEYNNQPGYNK